MDINSQIAVNGLSIGTRTSLIASFGWFLGSRRFLEAAFELEASPQQCIGIEKRHSLTSRVQVRQWRYMIVVQRCGGTRCRRDGTSLTTLPGLGSARWIGYGRRYLRSPGGRAW
ncbi:hypothetical protein RRF57_009488 [Xylaria bambusicola]|uniref:Uncharacterized protein n=1 Tax=Xylaria bambusicola TaxID=326684 RepID=A0AAN7UJQ2_9PEZI